MTTTRYITAADFDALFTAPIPAAITEPIDEPKEDDHPPIDHPADELADETRDHALHFGGAYLADAECEHGSLPHDRNLRCGCWTTTSPATLPPAERADELAGLLRPTTPTERSV